MIRSAAVIGTGGLALAHALALAWGGADGGVRKASAQEAWGDARIEERIPADGPDYSLSRVAGIVSPRPGEVWVLSGGEQAIRVFGADGRLLRSIGREGAGPGEFRSPRLLGQVGEVVWVFDPVLSRVTVFRPNGTLERTIAIPMRGHALLLRGGAVGVFTAQFFGGRGAGSPDSVTFTRLLKRDTATVFQAAADYRELQVPFGGRTFVGRQPFDDDPLVGMALDGTGLAFVERRTASGSGKAVFRVLRITETGDTAFVRSVAYTPVALGDGEVKAAIGRLTAPLQGSAAAASQGAFRKGLFIPRFLPPVTAVVVGRDGRVWVRREAIETRKVDTWLVLDSKGSTLMQVTVQRDFYPFEIAGDRLWGTVPDDSLGSSVVRMQVHRR